MEQKKEDLFAFILMPFKKEFRDVYELGIKAACSEEGIAASRVDEQFYSEGVLERIYSQIRAADIIIAEVSEKNANVFYELGYAHAKEKLCLLITSDTQQIPFDLKHQRHIEYEDISSLRNELTSNLKWAKNEINERKKKTEPNINPLVQRLNKELINKDFSILPKFRYELTKNVIDDATKETISIIQGKYSLDIGRERNFLLRAAPIFKNAKTINAISLSWISDFWVDAQNIGLANKYLQSQPPNTNRLFVFPTPDEANDFKNVMAANHRQYGGQGGVFFTSVDFYQDVLEGMGVVKGTVEELLEKDFGLLVYDNQGSEDYVEALLDTSTLEFQQLNESSTRYPVHKGFQELFNALKKLKHGESDNEKKIYRWNQEFLTNHVLWADALKELFTDRSRSVYHLVLFKEHIVEIDAIVEDLKRDLEVIQKKLERLCDIEMLWFGKNISLQVKDARFFGRLLISDEYKYALIMRLPSIRDLEVYYEDDKHSETREKLYSRLDNEIKYLYSVVNKKGKVVAVDREAIEHLAKILETLASKHIVRMDFLDDEKIDEIATKQGLTVM